MVAYLAGVNLHGSLFSSWNAFGIFEIQRSAIIYLKSSLLENMLTAVFQFYSNRYGKHQVRLCSRQRYDSTVKSKGIQPRVEHVAVNKPRVKLSSLSPFSEHRCRLSTHFSQFNGDDRSTTLIRHHALFRSNSSISLLLPPPHRRTCVRRRPARTGSSMHTYGATDYLPIGGKKIKKNLIPTFGPLDAVTFVVRVAIRGTAVSVSQLCFSSVLCSLPAEVRLASKEASLPPPRPIGRRIRVSFDHLVLIMPSHLDL